MAEPPSEPDHLDLDLTKTVNTRVSVKAKAMMQLVASKAGVTPGTWMRITIYRALGLIGSATSKRNGKAR